MFGRQHLQVPVPTFSHSSHGEWVLPVPIPGVDADLSWVVPGLAVGGQPTRQQTHRLRGLGIGAVLSLRAEDDPEDDARWAAHCGLKYQRVTVVDGVDICDDALEEIACIGAAWRQNSFGLLVHCQAGRRRGPIGAAAILVAEGWDVEQALQQLRETRRQFAPTPPQVRSLRRFAKRRAPLKWVACRVQQLAEYVTTPHGHSPAPVTVPHPDSSLPKSQ